VKRWVRERILESAFPDSAEGRPLLDAYFPHALSGKYSALFGEHALRREIIATVAANHVVNHAGAGFLPRLASATGAAVGAIVAAYVKAESESGVARLRSEIVGRAVDAPEEHARLLEIEDALTRPVVAQLGVAQPPQGDRTRSK
jgi:glutamate dehydrogenase